MLQTDPTLVNFLSDPKLQILLLVLGVWTLIWKGIALWQSSQHNQRNWFIALLIVNTFGILEIVYLFYFQRKKVNKSANE